MPRALWMVSKWHAFLHARRPLILALTVCYGTETVAPIWRVWTLKQRDAGQGDGSHPGLTANHTQKNLALTLEHLQRSSPKFTKSTPDLFPPLLPTEDLPIPGTGGVGPTDTAGCLLVGDRAPRAKHQPSPANHTAVLNGAGLLSLCQ